MSTRQFISLERTAATPPSFAPVRSGLLQRKCACGGTPGAGGECEMCRKKRVQRKVAEPSTLNHQHCEVLPIVHEVLRSPGQSLDPGIGAFMEARFGYDFSQVRIHTDERAVQSARAVHALAYTVGRDVVFGVGQFAPDAAAGRRLLAHELAHVVQQSDNANLQPEDCCEAEANRAAESVGAGGSAAPICGAPSSMQRRDGEPAVSEEERQAQRAELVCDIPALCRLRRNAPTVVTEARIRAVARSCRPGVLIAMDPCFMPEFMLSPSAVAPAPTTSPGSSAAASAASPSSGGLAGLSSLTTLHFSLGSARFTVELPSSVAVRLPVPLQGARTLEFNVSAETSGRFSLSLRINGLRHVQIEARVGVEVGEHQRATFGLAISTTRTVCRAMEPETAREQLQRKGEALRTAIQNLQNPPPSAAGANPPTTASRLADVASAVAELYDAIEHARARCHEVPVVTFGFTGEAPIGEATPERGPRGGATLTLHF